MKAPKFWQKHFSIISIILSPLGLVYNAVTKARVNCKHKYSANIPVICIGNITAGGNGKTPTAMAIADIFQQSKKKVCFVSKGYGASIDKTMPVVVNSKKHTAAEVGDEPLMLAQKAMCIICDSREKALIMAENLQVDFIILDDGFQDGSIEKSVSLIVVDATQGFGNGKCIPAGPCRENIEEALMRANACILIGEDIYNLEEFVSQFIPVIRAKIKPKKIRLRKNVFAFAGIGNPNKFYKSLEEIGCVNFETKSFKDHHKYTKKDLSKFPKDKQLVTTMKDYVKLPQDFKEKVKVLEIKLDIENKKDLKEVLK
ncbi:MAG: tetraacyldisaccharide 4'-kinase [Alphaproteobacteria bacterium]|nr:tetraacyldisaccharide 4'-kinase [Alphaproteobacteria bacterium]